MKSTTCKEEVGIRNTNFITERRYLKTSRQRPYHGTPMPSKRSTVQWSRRPRVSAISVNSWLRCINAFLNWSRSGFKIPKLKEEQKIIATLTPEQMARLIAFKPKGINATRTHMSSVLILDGGYRISELLDLPCENCDFEDLVVKVRGKGNKHRLVPLSVEMRKKLYRPRHNAESTRGSRLHVDGKAPPAQVQDKVK
jgi:site-specific recombinase XerD